MHCVSNKWSKLTIYSILESSILDKHILIIFYNSLFLSHLSYDNGNFRLHNSKLIQLYLLQEML